MFALIGFSIAVFLGAIASTIVLQLFLFKLVSPNLAVLISWTFATYFWRPAMRATWWVAASIWTPFLKYYGYEAHSLKPIKPKEERAHDNDH
jgi:hypothetical protein